ncbi:MAG TPA: type IX secretion system membrane protein PorP/SprF [Bacteroidia bacterium]|jgi:hypothetical protein|nr:type IX secretion system membrane protein PorP/SprF [Bacteroidia bacterium]
MKLSLTLAAIALYITGSACNDHLYRLALNQRSFYNPAALCPYCKGSYFLSAGLDFSPDVVGYGEFYAFGDDGKNKMHGPWDAAYYHSSSSGLDMNSYSFRYAYEKNLAYGWRVSAGIRASFMQVQKQFFHEGVSQKMGTSFADLDAGIFVTNQEGFYVGLSAQHLPAFSKTLQTGEEQSKISMNRVYGMNAGGVIPVCDLFDIMVEGNGVCDSSEYSSQLNAMVRFFSVVGVGGGVTYSQKNIPEYELRGGITSTAFKFLASMEFTPQGKQIEMGMVMRFERDGGLRFLSTPCTGGTCSAPKAHKKKKKDEFNPHA